MMLTAKELAARAMESLERASRVDPLERFNKMVELGLIDREGRVSSQIGGDAETLPITSPHILAR
jgi:hypothetical protein